MLRWGVNTATVQDALRQAVVSATGLTSGDVVKGGSAEASGWRGTARAYVTFLTSGRHGRDERRRDFTAPATRAVTHVGNRLITVTVRFESDAQSPGADAHHYADRLTTRIDRKSVRAALKAVKVSVLEVLPAITRDYQVKDRMVSVAIVELRVLAASIDVDDTADAATWIDTAHGEAPAVDGNDLAGAEFDAPEA